MDTTQLEKKLSLLEERIFQLEEKNRELNFKIIKLSNVKVSNPKYPYTNWLLKRDVSENKKEELMCLMAALTLRFEKKSITLRKNLTTIPDELLYKDTVPTYEESNDFINEVMGFKNEKFVIELLKCLYIQGNYKDLCKYLLTEADENLTFEDIE